MGEPNPQQMPQVAIQQEHHVPQPAQIFLPAVCKDLVETWVAKRLVEAKHLTTLIANKRTQLTKLVNHSANGTFPTDIHCSDPYRQYPRTIELQRVQIANDEETQLAITFKKGMLRIRTQALTQDLKIQEDKLKLFLHQANVMQQAEVELSAIPKTPEVLQEVANTFTCEYERQQFIYKESLAKKLVSTPANTDHPMTVANALDMNQLAIFQRNQEAMRKEIDSLKNRLKQKNSFGRGSGDTPHQKGNQGHEAHEKSALRGRSQQQSSANQKNRSNSSTSIKSRDSKTS